MLETFKRWFSSRPLASSLQGIEYWAEARGATHRRVRDSEGFVVDGVHKGQAWRIEWGHPQRPYIQGPELRIIAEMGLHRDLQVLIVNRALMDAAETTVFEQYIEGVQTRIETQIPTEIRWLVMYPKLASADLQALGTRFGAVSSVRPWLMQWLAGPLSPALLSAASRLAEADPFVMTVGRGRLTMRLPMREPNLDEIGEWLQLFQLALAEAARVAGEWQDSAFSPSSTRPSAWPLDARASGQATP
jgi:hypothetical protein